MIRTTITMISGALALVAVAAPAHADGAPAAGPAQAAAVDASIAAAVVFPQLQSELGTAPGVQLAAGYRVWSRLTTFLGVGYAQPSVTTAMDDPRLADPYETTTTQRELTVSVGARWRFLPADAPINGYAGAAARVWLLDTRTTGAAGGNTFLENQETSTRVGAAVLVGGEYRLGPGAAMAELDVGGSDLPHLITGDVATTAVAILLGYRLML